MFLELKPSNLRMWFWSVLHLLTVMAGVQNLCDIDA